MMKVIQNGILRTNLNFIDRNRGRNAPIPVFNSSIKQKTLDTLLKFARELQWKNVFKNPLLSYIEKELRSISFGDQEASAGIIETAIAVVYRYAKENGIDLDMEKSLYSQEDLDAMSYVAAVQAGI